jgi:DNA replication protein DnaC
MSALEPIRLYCKALRLPTLAQVFEQTLSTAQGEEWSLEEFVLSLLEQEATGRQQRRIERLTKQAHLPPGKTWATFDHSRLPLRLRRQLMALKDAQVLARADNILCFGLPGTGKTHAICALAYEWLQQGHSVLFTPTYKLVGQLLRAKRDYDLERALRRLDRFEALILDDIGYVQQSQAEMEVLFTLLAERYERRSVVITSNLVFSQWDQIFKNPLTTAAAIDRVVHHSVILEFGPEITSMRAEQAAQRNQKSAPALNRVDETPLERPASQEVA